MNCLITALENGIIKTFLTNEVFEEKSQVCKFCRDKGITYQICDFKVFDFLPEPAYVESLFIENGKIELDEKKLYEKQFDRNEAIILSNLIQVNVKNLEKAKQENDKLAEVLFNKNEQYLKSLKPEDFYTEEGKINRFFNVGALVITKSGSGYNKPIQATISAPPIQKNDKAANYFGKLGKKAKISCTQKDGKLANIFVEDWGCGYFEPPTITFSEPDDPNGEKPEVQVFPLNLIGIK
jgi:hypothetical protein